MEIGIHENWGSEPVRTPPRFIMAKNTMTVAGRPMRQSGFPALSGCGPDRGKIADFEDCHPTGSGDSQYILIKSIQDSQPRFGTAHAGGGPASRPPSPAAPACSPPQPHDSSFRRRPVRTIRRKLTGQRHDQAAAGGIGFPETCGFRPHGPFPNGQELRAGHQRAAA